MMSRFESLLESFKKIDLIDWSIITKFRSRNYEIAVEYALHEIVSLAKQRMVLPDYKNNPRLPSYDKMVQIVKDYF